MTFDPRTNSPQHPPYRVRGTAADLDIASDGSGHVSSVCTAAGSALVTRVSTRTDAIGVPAITARARLVRGNGYSAGVSEGGGASAVAISCWM